MQKNVTYYLNDPMGSPINDVTAYGGEKFVTTILSNEKRDDGGGLKIVQTFVTSLVDDPLCILMKIYQCLFVLSLSR